MNKRHLLFIPALMLTLDGHAQEPRTDPLGPLTECVNSDGFHYERKDRLPATISFRTINTATGPAKISTADGYRLMVYRKSSSPLVNLKIERSAQGHFADDRVIITNQMKEVAATSKPPNQVDLETSRQNDIEVLAINNVNIDQTPGVISFYTLLDAATGTVASAYILNQKPDIREFATNEEYAALRNRFVSLLADCMTRFSK